MENDQVLSQLSAEMRAELYQNILPFWFARALDRPNSGFYGAISNDLVVDPTAPRGSLLTSRILWTFSASCRYLYAPQYAFVARYACQDLITHFWDQEHSGLFWALAPDGTVIDPRKHLYGQAFGIYALIEFCLATHEMYALAKAAEMLRVIELYAHDDQHGGYHECFTQDWKPAEDVRLSPTDRNEKKSMNTHLHLMEAYTNLRNLWPSEEVIAHHRELIEIMMRRIVNPQTGHATLFFDEAWNPRSTEVSYGHDIEISWLLVEAAEMDGTEELIQEAKALAVRMAQAVYDEGLDTDGGLMYESGPEGWIDDSKEWWPQAEAVVGFLNAYQISGQQHFLDAALNSWAFIKKYLIDHEHGEWFRGVYRDGTLKADQPKVSFWKCPYHNGRMCLEVLKRVAAIQKQNK